MTSIWREKRVLLIILGLLLAINTVFFFTYRVQYEDLLTSLDERLDQVKNELQAARQSRVTADQQLAAYRKTQTDVQHVLETRWATKDERLTALINEVYRQADRSGFTPGSYSFTQTATESGGSSKRIGATQVGIAFTVEGTYQDVRRLINNLEMSEQFVIIDQISLTSMTGQTLTLNLHVKTLFRDTSAPPVRRGAGQNS
jgi:Tfp pilus assembly protein PilO